MSKRVNVKLYWDGYYVQLCHTHLLTLPMTSTQLPVSMNESAIWAPGICNNALKFAFHVHMTITLENYCLLRGIVVSVRGSPGASPSSGSWAALVMPSAQLMLALDVLSEPTLVPAPVAPVERECHGTRTSCPPPSTSNEWPDFAVACSRAQAYTSTRPPGLTMRSSSAMA